jgi:hypothetical protein
MENSMSAHESVWIATTEGAAVEAARVCGATTGHTTLDEFARNRFAARSGPEMRAVWRSFAGRP